MATDDHDISTANGLADLVQERWGKALFNTVPQSKKAGVVAQYFCSGCIARRRHYLYLLASPQGAYTSGTFVNGMSKYQLYPQVFAYECCECSSRTFATLLAIGNGLRLVLSQEKSGGMRTPNTPAAVAYYLDEAHRSKIGGAKSAAASMYRAALDHVLYQQGFRTRMLGDRLKELEAAVGKDSAPEWAKTIDRTLLDLLKAIGSGSIHTNDGNIEAQKVIDEDLLRIIADVMAALLDAVYEEPHRKAAAKAKLSAAAATLSKKP